MSTRVIIIDAENGLGGAWRRVSMLNELVRDVLNHSWRPRKGHFR